MTQILEAPTMTRLERAKAILAGTSDEPPLQLPVSMIEAQERSWAARGVVPTEKARRFQFDGEALEYHFAGKGPVLSYKNDEGVYALAVGDDEVYEVLHGLKGLEKSGMAMCWPLDPFWGSE